MNDSEVKEEFDRFLNWLTAPEPDPNGKHTHVCPNCEYRWSHENSCVDNKPAHTCRECGTEQWEFDVRDTGGDFQTCMVQPNITQ